METFKQIFTFWREVYLELFGEAVPTHRLYNTKCVLEKYQEDAHFRAELTSFNPLTPNDPYSGRTAPLTSKRFILYSYSTNIGTEYFKHGIYPPFFTLKNAVCFILLTYLVPVLFTFYLQGLLKLKK